jgi:hypothetical protein
MSLRVSQRMRGLVMCSARRRASPDADGRPVTYLLDAVPSVRGRRGRLDASVGVDGAVLADVAVAVIEVARRVGRVGPAGRGGPNRGLHGGSADRGQLLFEGGRAGGGAFRLGLLRGLDLIETLGLLAVLLCGLLGAGGLGLGLLVQRLVVGCRRCGADCSLGAACSCGGFWSSPAGGTVGFSGRARPPFGWVYLCGMRENIGE